MGPFLREWDPLMLVWSSGVFERECKGIVGAIAVAYVATGAVYVVRKMQEQNLIRLAPFEMRYRRERSFGLLMLLVLSWSLSTAINREGFCWLVFIILGGVGVLIVR